MKGDIAFVGFMLTAGEWQELDAEARASLIAVATRRADPVLDLPLAPPRRFPEGTGKHEIVESLDDELDELLELDLLDGELLEPIGDGTKAALEAELARIDRDGDLVLFSDDAITFDTTAEYDALEEWLALQPEHEHIDLDEWVSLPPACVAADGVLAVDDRVAQSCADAAGDGPFEDFADWNF